MFQQAFGTAKAENRRASIVRGKYTADRSACIQEDDRKRELVILKKNSKDSYVMVTSASEAEEILSRDEAFKRIVQSFEADGYRIRYGTKN